MGLISTLLQGAFEGILDGIFGSENGSNEREKLEIKKEELQQQVNELAKEANARLDALEENEMRTPAYSQWEQDGAVRFGVEGKTYQQVQSEYWRIKNFLDAKTSTVEGARSVLDNISANTGFYGQSGELTQDEATQYFRLADRIKEYYIMSGESAKALDYQKIWEQVNMAIDRGIVILDDVDKSVSDIERIAREIEKIEERLEEIDREENASNMTRSRSSGTVIGGVFRAIGSFFKGLFTK